jgi:superfamily II DNA or RNA helicase
MIPFFVANKRKFRMESDQGVNFRKCQLGAVWAVKSHFTKSDVPGLISMPTGSGKTALMMALAFELKAKKILIVTPSKVITEVLHPIKLLKIRAVDL